MSKMKISQRKEKYNNIIKAVNEYTELDRKPLVILLLQSGLSTKEISTKFGTSEQTIKNWLKKWGEETNAN
jgi:transposase